MQDYHRLQIWGRSHAVTRRVYEISRQFPDEEKFGLTSQMRRAAASVPANIAEGCGRFGDPELRRFLLIALGSACELDYFVTLAADLGYLSPEVAPHLAAEILEIRQMLGGFIQKLKK